MIKATGDNLKKLAEQLRRHYPDDWRRSAAVQHLEFAADYLQSAEYREDLERLSGDIPVEYQAEERKAEAEA